MSEATSASSASAPFEYLALSSETRQVVQRSADEIHGLLKRTTEHIVRIGQHLKTVKELLPYGQFLLWIQAEFAMSRVTAHRFMRVAERLQDTCSTMKQVPLGVLYELAAPSTSEEIFKEVQQGHIPATLEAVKAAKEAEQQAREESRQSLEEQERLHQQLLAEREAVQKKQAMIEHLSAQMTHLQDQITTLSSAPEQIKEVEKLVTPPEVQDQLEYMQQPLQEVKAQRDRLASRVEQLGEEARAAAIKRGEGEQARRLRLQWYQASTAFRSNVTKLLSQWPSPLDTVVFEADDWTRLSQVMEVTRRLLHTCEDLMQARTVESGAATTMEEEL